MRVLWFTNTMMPDLAKHLGTSVPNVGGWMPSLLEAFRKFSPDVEIGVVCSGRSPTDVVLRGVRYFIIPNPLDRSADAVVNAFAPDVIHIHGSEGIALGLSDSIVGGNYTLLSIQGVLGGYAPHCIGALTPCEIGGFQSFAGKMLHRGGVFTMQRHWVTQRVKQERLLFSKLRNVAGRTDWDLAWARYLNPQARYFRVGEVLREAFYAGRRKSEDVRRHTIYCSAALSYPLKGGHWLLMAVAKLKKTYPDVQLRIVAAKHIQPQSFIGLLRQSQYHRYICWLIRELGISENVVLLGGLDAEGVANELRRAEVFCLPSHCENSPNSLGEAMMIGVPCVATYVGGTPSMMDNGEEGLLIPSGDPASIAAAIQRLFENPDLAESFAASAFVRAQERFAVERVCGELKNAYRDVIRSASS